MARKVIRTYVKPKRKSHPHSKNASVGQKGYNKKQAEERANVKKKNKGKDAALATFSLLYI